MLRKYFIGLTQTALAIYAICTTDNTFIIIAAGIAGTANNILLFSDHE